MFDLRAEQFGVDDDRPDAGRRLLTQVPWVSTARGVGSAEPGLDGVQIMDR